MPERVSPWPRFYDALKADRLDAETWTEIAARLRYLARRGLYRFGEDIVEEAAQDACMRVFVGFDRARGRETFEGFVYGCYMSARNAVLTHEDRPLEPLDDVDETDATPLGGGLEVDERAALIHCLAELPETHRDLVRLVYLNGYRPSQLTDRFSKTANALRVRLHRALCALRCCIRKTLEP